mmetsp:Transcript_28902/g.68217  ORF Transcript_28902/g.68217 Transcript_28902/m.68217 type:complete len:87 (-) Transcript_28902:26-286(-)|eukprot:CAMPEP_0175855588 /NCGR_PEP_ID=MMETSP0107_2-20121207/28009_1 /TAXON_ID=195067 ORGANISM="Goniomonas pacifica, Strain CCMP1869" /NCGR_SAMPLE_ID=MMETSP0107_2 /ASSEMBLY_ACC=CAM_ASM_000203 /LENGTH=86 /DNA_ID=CAMNT_0017171565 /DNA_START=20 /DNA_END=280 /DNA_ORIENTATION=+
MVSYGTMPPQPERSSQKSQKRTQAILLAAVAALAMAIVLVVFVVSPQTTELDEAGMGWPKKTSYEWTGAGEKSLEEQLDKWGANFE